MTAVVRIICLSLATIAFSSTQARAEIVLNLGAAGDASTIGQTVFSIAPGTTLTVDLYATQQGLVNSQFGPISDLRLSQNDFIPSGVGAYIMDVSTFNAAGNQQGNVAPTGVVTPGAGFYADFPPAVNPPSGLRFQGVGGVAIPDQIPVYASNTATAVANVPTPGTIQENSVLLGSFELRAVTGATGNFTLQVTAQPDLGFTLGSNPLGPYVTNIPTLNATLTTAVPEPGMFAALGIAACGFGYRQRRKSKRAKETQPQA